MPYDRFLNLAQHAMFLTLSDEDREAVVRDLAAPSTVGVVRDPDAPDWWFGDEEASRSNAAAAAMIRSSG